MNQITVPIELRVGSTSAEVAQMTITSDPEVWRPKLADLLRQVADEIEHPSEDA